MVTSKKLLGEHDLFQSDEPVNVDASLPAVAGSSTSLGFPIDTTINDIINIHDLLVPTSETVKYAGSGLVFVNNYGAGVTTAFHDAIIKAENFFQSHFTNSVTLNVSFDLQAIDDKNSDGSWKFSGKNFYGDSIVHVSYADLKNALTAHATTADDIAAVNSLPGSDPSGGQTFDVSVGMARILGLAPAGSGTDDSIVLNSHLSWTFGDDAVGVLEHEISEGAMGRVSELGVEGNGHWAPMDLFRYSATEIIYAGGIPVVVPIPSHDYTGGKDGLATYFSVDGVPGHLLTQFHNSIDSNGNNDGFDLADWNSTLGDAFGPGGPGAPGYVSDTDLKVLDILGWTPTASILDRLKYIDLAKYVLDTTTVLHGARGEYSISTSVSSDGLLHIDLVDQGSAGDGHLDLVNVEHLQFTDKTVFVENADNANIARLYSAALGRAPDAAGLDGWEAAYASNVSAAAKAQGVYVALAETPINGLSIAGGFTHSPEFQQKYGPLTDAQFVNQLYHNVLGRDADAAGLNGWLDAMHHGTTREVVLVGFAESPENIAKTGHDWLIQV